MRPSRRSLHGRMPQSEDDGRRVPLGANSSIRVARRSQHRVGSNPVSEDEGIRTLKRSPRVRPRSPARYPQVSYQRPAASPPLRPEAMPRLLSPGKARAALDPRGGVMRDVHSLDSDVQGQIWRPASKRSMVPGPNNASHCSREALKHTPASRGMQQERFSYVDNPSYIGGELLNCVASEMPSEIPSDADEPVLLCRRWKHRMMERRQQGLTANSVGNSADGLLSGVGDSFTHAREPRAHTAPPRSSVHSPRGSQSAAGSMKAVAMSPGMRRATPALVMNVVGVTESAFWCSIACITCGRWAPSRQRRQRQRRQQQELVECL